MLIADLTLSDCDTRTRFTALSGKLCSVFLLARNTCSQDLQTFSLACTIVSHCGHTLLGGHAPRDRNDSNVGRRHGALVRRLYSGARAQSAYRRRTVAPR